MTLNQRVNEPNLGRGTVFVTGATGLLGSNLVRELVSRGFRVKALVRSLPKARRYLSDLGIEVVQGDMADVNGFRHALEGCSAVFHTAAYFREYYQPGDHDAALEKINVEGTLALMRASDAAGVSRFVHTSSSGAVGMRSDGAPGDEETPPASWQLENRYFLSKVRGDVQIKAFIPRSGLQVVEVLPGWMWGPGDAAPTAAGQMLLDFTAGKIPLVPEGGTNMVDARDVAASMVELLERGRHGDRFIVAGEYRELSEVLDDLSAATGKPAPTLKLPFALVLAFAWLALVWSKLSKAPLLVSPEGVKMMRARHRVSSSRAMRELGVEFRPFVDTVRDAYAWYRADGRISPGAG